MFCQSCGTNVANAKFCVKCGSKIEIEDNSNNTNWSAASPPDRRNYRQEPPQHIYNTYVQPPSQPTIVNVQNSATAVSTRIPKRRSFLFDLIMIVLTSGIWIIWMIFRRKYY